MRVKVSITHVSFIDIIYFLFPCPAFVMCIEFEIPEQSSVADLLFSLCLQHCTHVGREVREAAQICVQATLLSGEEGGAHMLHLQPRREADSSRLPGWHHPDLGQKPQRECSNSLECAPACKHRLSVFP